MIKMIELKKPYINGILTKTIKRNNINYVKYYYYASGIKPGLSFSKIIYVTDSHLYLDDIYDNVDMSYNYDIFSIIDGFNVHKIKLLTDDEAKLELLKYAI